MTMKSNSPLFDGIRVKPDKDRRLRKELPPCQWPRCDAPGTHRAPKGRDRATEYWQFCLEHVREYNNSYNFFAGMTDDAVAKYQKEALTGHRPTWKMGSIGGKPAAKRAARGFRGTGWAADDPFSLFGEAGDRMAGNARNAPETRKILNAQRRALDVLDPIILLQSKERRDYVCRERLIGARSFTDGEMQDPILRGRDDLRNPCDRVGPLSFEYYVSAASNLWSSIRGAGSQAGQ
jgi:hypothetical protein